MLSKEDNELLTRVGPGTPMGEFFRRFWLPALLPSEVPEPDSPPVRLRLLGEDLVAFRNTSGKIGILGPLCSHRGAPLFFGRNEQEGLRCVYHGWKYDIDGNCVDMPNEPVESNFKEKIHQKSYPAREYGGLIWVYMGPNDFMPELPQLEWALVPDSHRHVAKWFHDSNYAQALEGEIDTSHISFLHSYLDPAARPSVRGQGNTAMAQFDGAPRLTLRETEYGFTYGARRSLKDGANYYWRVTQWLLPNYSLIAGGRCSGRCWIPIDDEHTWAFSYSANPERPLTDEERARTESGASFPPRMIPGTFQPLANRNNDYLIDRQMQRSTNYTGILGINEQDRALQENMGSIFDRGIEHLGTADAAVILARRILLRLAQQVQEGVLPYAAQHGEVYRVRALDIIEPQESFDELLKEHEEEVMVRA